MVSFFHPNAAHESLDHPRPLTMGHEAWTILPWRWLNREGFPCQLIDRFPESGLVLAHRDHIPPATSVPRQCFLVSIRADRRPAVEAPAEIVINPTAAAPNRIQPRFYIPHYPLEGVRPRRSDRPPGVVNVVYTGNPENLAPEILQPPFQQWMADHGFRLLDHSARAMWEDFTEADALLALRDVHGHPWHSKPPTKLINAWQAGIPALLGHETAYRAVGRDGVDCLFVRTVDDVCAALLRLRADPQLWSRIVEEGTRRYEAEYSFQQVTARWRELLEGELIPRAQHWAQSPYARARVSLVIAGRHLNIRLRGLRH